MQKWKSWQIAAFALGCLTLNYGGRVLCQTLSLPLWLDCFGTMLAAALGGPLVGGLIGVTGNILHAIAFQETFLYSLTSVLVALVVSFAARRGKFDTVYGALTTGVVTALAALLVSVPLNIALYAGSTGNVWGDGVMGYLGERGWPGPLCAIAGQFYLEFLDKQLSVLLLAGVLRLLGARAQAGEAACEEPDDAPPVEGVLAALLALVSVFLLTPAHVQAANDYNNYVQTVFSSNNGLPCGEANDICETNDGILWVGTYAGLYRLNGQEFRWMDQYDSVRNVNCLYVDGEGRLWIGTNDNGLSIAINEQIVNVIDQSGGLPSNSVRSIIQGTDGYYYIGTTGSMQILTLNSGLKRVNTLWEINYADKIAADNFGHVAAITTDGRLFLLKGGQILSSLRLGGGEELFNTCAFDRAGRLMVGTSGSRILLYDITSGAFEPAGELSTGELKSINDLRALDNGEIFIAADNGTGYYDEMGAYHRVNTNGFDNSIDNMLVDYQGNLWFTSSRLGLLRIAPSAFRDVYSTLGMENRVVNAVARWQDCYYFGTDRGLDVVDGNCQARVTNALSRDLEGVRIRCLLADSRDSLWICTYGAGLIEVEPSGVRHLYNAENGSFGSRARMVTELSDGTIAAAGDTGISFLRDHAVIRTIGLTDGLINSMILTLVEMPDGLLLAGTDGDGIAVIEDGQVVHMMKRSDGLSSEVILRMVRDEVGNGVYVVTSNGLCYLDAEGSIRPLSNFPYFNNYDIWPRDEDTLFVMSSAGLFVANREDVLADEPGMRYDLLDSRRGLNGALTANSWSYADEAGNLYLPCDLGVFVIDSRNYQSGAQTYRMLISSVLLDGESHRIERSMPLEISRGVSRIEVFPEILNYTIEDPNVGYYLEGFDAQWTIQPQSGLTSIVYTNLPSGEYTLHLAVFDSAQETILEERTCRLVKEKEIYDNQWFVIYILLVPMIAIAWLTWFVMRRHIQRTLLRQEHELALARQQIQMGNETILAIAKAVDAKDERTSQHSLRVSEYSVMIAREMGFSESECENLRKAAQMHDIGKIGIPDNILNKPARLTDEEYAVMKSHVTRGAEILKDFTLIDHVVEGALHHHERYDGKGYPLGLKGEEIPLYGRIIGVADAFDAMTANRVYRRQMDFTYVLDEMRKGRGTQFDPQAVDILLRLIEEGKIDLNKLYPPRAEDAQAGGEPV